MINIYKPFVWFFCLAMAIMCTVLLAGPQELPGSENKTDQAEILVLTGVTVIDGVSDRAKPDGTIVIKDQTITDVFYGQKNKENHIPDKAMILNLKGHYVLPGLIDAHVHISHEGRAATEEALRIALLGGVTSVRDMAGDMRRLAGLKRDANLNEIISPNIYYSALVSGPSFFSDPRVIEVSQGETTGAVSWARQVTDSSDIRQIIAEAKGTGATGIKLYADMEPDLVKRIVNEAHKQGLKTWSHLAIFPSLPHDIIDAGINVVSHSEMFRFQYMKDAPKTYAESKAKKIDLSLLETHANEYKELFSRMARKNMIIDATIFVYYYNVTRPPCNEDDKTRLDKMSKRLEFAVKATTMAHRNGVKIAAGTDFMCSPGEEFPNLHTELELLVTKCGMTPLEAIQSATRINAETLGIETRTGTIEKGKMADLLVLTGNPLADIKNTRTIRIVIKEGRINQR